jgi:hypothetical protein
MRAVSNILEPVKTKASKVGSRVRVQLYSGRVVEAEVTAILNQSAGGSIFWWKPVRCEL